MGAGRTQAAVGFSLQAVVASSTGQRGQVSSQTGKPSLAALTAGGVAQGKGAWCAGERGEGGGGAVEAGRAGRAAGGAERGVGAGGTGCGRGQHRRTGGAGWTLMALWVCRGGAAMHIV